jgi:hypothetical protein
VVDVVAGTGAGVVLCIDELSSEEEVVEVVFSPAQPTRAISPEPAAIQQRMIFFIKVLVHARAEPQ